MIVIPSFEIANNIKYWNVADNTPIFVDDRANKINNNLNLLVWNEFDNIVQNLKNDEEDDNFIIEQEYLIVFIPDQPNQLFTFPDGIDVLYDPLFQLESLLLPYNNDNNSILDLKYIQEADNTNNNNNNMTMEISNTCKY